MGWTTHENFVQRDGRVLTDQLSTYLIPTVVDVAQVKPVILEFPDPQGPLGARHGRDALHPHGAAIVAACMTPPASGSTSSPDAGAGVARLRMA